MARGNIAARPIAVRVGQLVHTSGRGLGFEVGEMYPEGCGHTGFTGTSLYLSKTLGVGCVILTNRCFYPDGNYKLTNPFRRKVNQLAAAHFGRQQKDSDQ